jgi:hypothetical protein
MFMEENIGEERKMYEFDKMRKMNEKEFEWN